MIKDFHDALEIINFNSTYGVAGINPLYANLILYLHEIGVLELGKDEYSQLLVLSINKEFQTNPDIFKNALKYAIKNGFIEKISSRYISLHGSLSGRHDNINRFTVIKFKIIDDNLYIYNQNVFPENRRYLQVTDINGTKVEKIINVFKKENFSNEEIESLIQHKEILSAYGFESEKFEIKINDMDDCINFDDPELKLNSDIFFKAHAKSELLDKGNFTLSISSDGQKTNNSYGYDCNLKLLAMLHGLCKSEEDLNMFENIYRLNIELIGYAGTSDTNLDWMFISSFFIINQEENNDLPNYVYQDLEKKLSLTTQDGPCCIFLDEKSEEQSFGYNVTYDTYGCNDYVYRNGKIDTKMIFHAIRNALAHSSYEVINQDYIRIYGYDEKKDIMNYNFKVKKDIIIEFINKISKFKSFGNLFPICTLEKPIYDNSIIFDNSIINNPDELEQYLKNIIVSSVEIKKYRDLDLLEQFSTKILASVEKKDFLKIYDMYEYDYERKIQHMKLTTSHSMMMTAENIQLMTERELKYFADFEYKKIKLTPEQIEKIKRQINQIKDTFYNHCLYNQHDILTELIKNELDPNRNISEIISDIIKSGNKIDGSIMDTLNEESQKYVNYDKVVKATIIAYLNNILLYSFNRTQTLINEKQKEINHLKKETKKKEEERKKATTRIKDLESMLLYKDNQDKASIIDEKNKKEEESQEALLTINKNREVIASLEEEIKPIKNDDYVNNYSVLKHLRNSLAHGNIFFSDTININNIGQLEIKFIDYYPQKDKSKQPEKSFEGTIKFGALLNCLNQENFIKSLFNNVQEKSSTEAKKR